MNPGQPHFVTKAGVKVPAITTDQMREVDHIAMEETGPNLFQMMENAGRNLALMASDVLGIHWQQSSIVVLAGTGGNGGGGICAARHLANHGAQVKLCLTNPAKLTEVPTFQRHIFQGTCGQEIDISELGYVSPDLIIDALIGYSLRSAPRGVPLQLIQWANSQNAPILALDVPSGVDSTSGEAAGERISAQWTMTLALPKTGLVAKETGELHLADIGIPASVYQKLGLEYTTPFEGGYLVSLSVGNV